jgi:hypothetical protein
VGSNIVLFYYGVGGGPYPGYILTPNTPFRLNGEDGQTIGFYFTYSVPEGGERNTIAENTSYTIGTCGEVIETDPGIALSSWQMEHFDAADLLNPALEGTLWGDLADPDLDGLVNLMEFASGTDPLLASAAPLSWKAYPESGLMRLRFTRRAGLPANYGSLEKSADLVNWDSGGIELSVVSLKDGIELIEANVESSSDTPVFVRMLVSP